jgi:arginyl-tRNA synthetase
LEDGDQTARDLWQQCITWSWKEFSRIYNELEIDLAGFENDGKGYGESYFEDKMAPVIAELKERNLLKTGDEGAEIIEFPLDTKLPPLMVIKKDGATLYATRDLATDKFRLEKYGSDVTVINEVGIEQSLYFQQLYMTEKLLGWFEDSQRIHVKHGHYRFKEGKMSTRKGNVIWLEEVIQEAVKRAKDLGKINSDSVSAKQVAIGALKWNDLKRSSHLDVTFDWDDILNMQGNSGPYLQYTAVRCASVIEKSNKPISAEFDTLLNKEERAILVKLLEYPEAVIKSTLDYAPHYLCTYLYEFAQIFNAFYNQHKIIGADNESLRLMLARQTQSILVQGLTILGISVPESM